MLRSSVSAPRPKPDHSATVSLHGEPLPRPHAAAPQLPRRVPLLRRRPVHLLPVHVTPLLLRGGLANDSVFSAGLVDAEANVRGPVHLSLCRGLGPGGATLPALTFWYNLAMPTNAEQKKVIELRFPTNGIDLTTEFGAQMGATTPVAVNVATFDSQQQRARGGSRPGLKKLISQKLPLT